MNLGDGGRDRHRTSDARGTLGTELVTPNSPPAAEWRPGMPQLEHPLAGCTDVFGQFFPLEVLHLNRKIGLVLNFLHLRCARAAVGSDALASIRSLPAYMDVPCLVVLRSLIIKKHSVTGKMHSDIHAQMLTQSPCSRVADKTNGIVVRNERLSQSFGAKNIFSLLPVVRLPFPGFRRTLDVAETCHLATGP